METPVMLPKQINVAKLTYGAPKSLDNGGKSIYIGYEGKLLYIQTPEMATPFGMSKWNADKSDKEKYTVELSFKGADENPAKKKFQELLAGFDKELIQQGVDNSSAWFKKQYKSTEVVEALYTHMLKHPKDKDTGEITDKYPPTFRLNIPFRDGAIGCPVYDSGKEVINIADIEKGSKVTAIIQCLGIWVAGGKFGCSWKVVQLRVVRPTSFKGFAFRDTDEKVQSDIESNHDHEDAQPAMSEDGNDSPVDADGDGVSKTVASKVEDEDEIIESSDGEEDEIEAPKPVAKKVAASKPAVVKKVAPKK